MQNVYVVFKKEGRPMYKQMKGNAYYMKKEEAVKETRKLAAEGIPAIITGSLTASTLELLEDAIKMFKKSDVVAASKELDDYESENYLDSLAAEKAAERYCRAHSHAI